MTSYDTHLALAQERRDDQQAAQARVDLAECDVIDAAVDLRGVTTWMTDEWRQAHDRLMDATDRLVLARREVDGL